MGADRNSFQKANLYHAMIGQVTLGDVIINTVIPHLDIVPSNQDLIGIEVEFVGMEEKEKRIMTL
jgi:chromosome partitioning protein